MRPPWMGIWLNFCIYYYLVILKWIHLILWFCSFFKQWYNRIVFRLKKFDRVSHIRKRLHWLPVRERIHYKIAVITFNVLYGNGPRYLRELLIPLNNQRSLRSVNKNLLVVPKTKLKSSGDRALMSTAPKIWNDLPINLRKQKNIVTFKRELKTYLFRKAYMS